MRKCVPAAAVLLLTSAASAQDVPKVEAFAGYSYRRVERGRLSDGSSLGSVGRHGWQASLTWNVWGSRLGLMGDVAGHYGASKPNSLSFMGGPRYVIVRRDSVTPFVYVLAGGIRSNSGVKVFGVSIGESGVDLAAAGGAGFDVKIRQNWAVRVQGDYFVVRTDGENDARPRAAAGLVYRIGRK
jgi:hypothetical protein